MTRAANKPGLLVGVVGAGTMGRGIAQVGAIAGFRVYLYDAKDGAAGSAVEFIDRMLNRAVEKGRMKAADCKAALKRIEVVNTISAFASCDVVIEAVIENLEIKQQVFADIEVVVAEDAVLATNTSSFSVARIASACKHPERVAGLHFFNPVPLMPLVEVIRGIKTETWVTDFLFDLGTRMGRQPVRVADAPGFLVNQVGRGYTIEAAHLVSEGVGSFADVDRIMRDLGGFRMGPFELLDLTALDVTHPATIEIYEQYYHEPRFRPSELMGIRLQAGLLGRKVGQGFYLYKEGKRVAPAEDSAPPFEGGEFWLGAAAPDARDALTMIIDNAGGEIDSGDQPAANSIILVTPLGKDASSVAAEDGLDATRTLAVDTLFGLDKRRVLMKTPVTVPEATCIAHAVLAADGTPVTVLRDSPGFVAQRIVAMIVNIGASVAQKGIATPADIDKAVRLGLNYPHGPLGFGDSIGAGKVLLVLENLFRLYGDPRYRPSPWLRRRAQLGVSLLTPES